VSVLPATLPAERLRGAHWASQLRSASDVVRDGGTVYGAPVFGPNGVTLDGTDDYLVYNVLPNEWAKDEFSVKLRFTPDFAVDDGASHYWYDTTSNDYRLFKSAGDVLVLYLGNTQIFSLALGGFQAAWIANAENTFAVTAASGDTSCWLNGILIVDADASAWTPTTVSTLYIGVRESLGPEEFAGIIHELKFFNRKLTDQEALDYCNGTTFNYMDDPVVNLPMDLERRVWGFPFAPPGT